MTPEQRRIERQNRPPTWRRAFLMGAMTAGFLLLAFLVFLKRDTAASVQFALLSLALYVPAFYFFESFTYQRRQRLKQRASERDRQDDS